MTIRTVTLDEVIRVALERRLVDVHVAMPAKVISYDASKQSCAVQPLVANPQATATDTDALLTLPNLQNVPVVFPGSGSYRITFPVLAGDFVMLVFGDRSLDNFKSGVAGDTGARNSHALSDAIAIPGLRTFSSPLKSAPLDRATFGLDGGEQIEVLSGRVNLGTGASQALVLGGNYSTHMTALSNALTTLSSAITPFMLPPAAAAAKAALQLAITAANNLAADISSTSFTT